MRRLRNLYLVAGSFRALGSGLCRPLVETLDDRDGRVEAFLAGAESVEEIAQLRTIVAVKDDSVLVLGSTAPRRAFIVQEPRLVAALLEYLGNLPH